MISSLARYPFWFLVSYFDSLYRDSLTSMRSKLAEQSSPKKSLTKGIEPTAQEDIAGPELEMDVIASE